MKIKTSELTGAALDWAVCVANGETRESWLANPYSYSKYWNFGGPIIDREDIDMVKVGASNYRAGFAVNNLTSGYGPTKLIAAMRCYVAFKMGDVVDIPEGLTL